MTVFPFASRLAFGGAVIAAGSYGIYSLAGPTMQSSLPIEENLKDQPSDVSNSGAGTFKDKYPNVRLVEKSNGNWNSNIKKFKQKFLQENTDKIIEEFGEDNLSHSKVDLKQYPKRINKWKNERFSQFLISWCYGSEDSEVDSVHSLMYEFCISKVKR